RVAGLRNTFGGIETAEFVGRRAEREAFLDTDRMQCSKKLAQRLRGGGALRFMEIHRTRRAARQLTISGERPREPLAWTADELRQRDRQRQSCGESGEHADFARQTIGPQLPAWKAEHEFSVDEIRRVVPPRAEQFNLRRCE